MPVLDKRRRNDPRREATERALLDAALALLDEGVAFADLNVKRITERAGRTRPAFYAHFEDRRELLFALLEQAGGQALNALGPFIAGAGRATEPEVVTSTRALLDSFAQNATLVRAVTEAAGYDDAVAAYWASIVDQIIGGAEQRLQAEGLTVHDAHATATALVWMTERLCYQQTVRRATDLTDDAAVAAISRVWWSTLCMARTQAP
ncbi:TetR/AcrR family transcriptional regulator [Paraconexibacter sp. AEG42_29]|uniref:TetR/AcrR family transcriptional regulator n=1 Tax=Paraconexibacter sp. AEG42_29 TaxID=2997339 RepID=UPI00339D8DA3